MHAITEIREIQRTQRAYWRLHYVNKHLHNREANFRCEALSKIVKAGSLPSEATLREIESWLITYAQPGAWKTRLASFLSVLGPQASTTFGRLVRAGGNPDELASHVITFIADYEQAAKTKAAVPLLKDAARSVRRSRELCKSALADDGVNLSPRELQRLEGGYEALAGTLDDTLIGLERSSPNLEYVLTDAIQDHLAVTTSRYHAQWVVDFVNDLLTAFQVSHLKRNDLDLRRTRKRQAGDPLCVRRPAKSIEEILKPRPRFTSHRRPVERARGKRSKPLR